MTVEKLDKWEPVPIVSPAARASIAENHEGLVVTLIFSEIIEAVHSDLRINFGLVPGYCVYEEFFHPWDAAAPQLAGKWARYSYPLLLVQNSEWLESLTNRLIDFPSTVHYRLLTLDRIVDVLCNEPAEVTWVKAD